MTGTNDDDPADLSMYLYKIAEQRLVSRETALAFARLLITDRFGADELPAQEPLTIHEENDTWVVRGRRKPDWNDGRPIELIRHGRAEVIISQFDGRILKLTVDAPLPKADTGA